VEVGSRGHGRVGALGIGWDVAAYRAELHNELLAVGLWSATSTATINADRTLHQGIELGLRLSRGAWTWSTSATLNYFRFDGDATYGDKRIAGLPTAFGVSELRWNGPAGYVAPSIQAATRTWSITPTRSMRRATGCSTCGSGSGRRTAGAGSPRHATCSTTVTSSPPAWYATRASPVPMPHSSCPATALPCTPDSSIDPSPEEHNA
jgi:hypothetical protein